MRKRGYLAVVVIMLALVILAGCTHTAQQNTAGKREQPKREAGSSSSAAKTETSTATKDTVPPNAVKPQSPVEPEKNPPGDIPDNQVFVAYTSTEGHFQAKVPEGWAQSASQSSVSFTDKLNTILMQWAPSSVAPTVEHAQSSEVQELSRTELAFQLVCVKQVSLPGGTAILITYRENSAPNQVTGKQYRMDVLRYEFYRNGVQVNLTLSSPVGADNVDPWNTISRSFKWLQ